MPTPSKPTSKNTKCDPPFHSGSVRRATFLISAQKFLAQAILFYWGIYFTNIGLSGAQQGILFAIFPIVTLLVVVPIGFLNDRIPSKYLSALGFILLASDFVGFAVFNNFQIFILVSILGGIGTNLITLSVDSFFYKNSNREKSKEIGSYVGTFLLASGLGTFTGGTMLQFLTFQTWLYTLAGVTLLMALFCLTLPKNIIFKEKIKAYKNDLWNFRVMAFIIVIFLWAVHFGAENTSYGLFLRENLHLSYQVMGLYTGLAIITMYGWSRYASVLIHHGMSVTKILTIGLIAAAIGQLIMTIPSLPISFLGRLIHEGGDAFGFVFLYHGVRKLFPQERVGGSAGIMRFSDASGAMLGAFLFAPLGSTYGNSYVFWVSSGLIVLALPFVYFLRKDLKH
ncbi:MAG: MFS transporter [Candidatus Gracilibacteria bacterium]|jgi:MFS family permease